MPDVDVFSRIIYFRGVRTSPVLGLPSACIMIYAQGALATMQQAVSNKSSATANDLQVTVVCVC